MARPNFVFIIIYSKLRFRALGRAAVVELIQELEVDLFSERRLLQEELAGVVRPSDRALVDLGLEGFPPEPAVVEVNFRVRIDDTIRDSKNSQEARRPERQRSHSLIVEAVGVCALLEQVQTGPEVARLESHVERGVAAFRLHVNVGASLDQKPAELLVSVSRGVEKRRVALRHPGLPSCRGCSRLVGKTRARSAEESPDG